MGGVVVFRAADFRKVNGWSGSYWGWGGEDDDMGKRAVVNGLPIQRDPKEFRYSYTMMGHTKRRRASLGSPTRRQDKEASGWTGTAPMESVGGRGPFTPYLPLL